MKWDIDEIGRFGFKVGTQFKPQWFTLWRKDDHFNLQIFKMKAHGDSVKSSDDITLELGAKVITDAADNGKIDSWEQSYRADGESDLPDGFTWSFDIADRDAGELFMSHGVGTLPPKDLFDAVIAAIREADPTFGEGYDFIG